MKIIHFSLLAFLTLAACGVKPRDVDAPQGADKDYFPRSYPTFPMPPAEKYVPK